jgi:hypothetical protein
MMVLTICAANFPWLEPQVLKTLRKSDAGKAAKLMHTTAVALIMARKESQQPPKVCVYKLLM